MKKTLIFLLVLMLLCQSVFAAGMGVYPLGDGRVEISGKKNPTEETTVVLFDESTGEIIGVTQVGAGEGEFSEVLDIGTPDGANYTIRINGDDTVVKNITPTNAVALLQAAALAEVEGVLTTYCRIFDIDIELLKALVDPSGIIAIMEAETFANEADVKSKYEAAIADAVEAEIETALQMIADGEAEDAIENYYGLFAIDYDAYSELADVSKVYDKLNGKTYEKEAFEAAFAECLLVAQISEAEGVAFADIVKANDDVIGFDADAIEADVFTKLDDKVFDDFADIVDSFIKESALYKVNAATKSTIQSVLEANNDILGVLDVEGYSALNSEQKAAACKALKSTEGIIYDSVEDIIEIFEVLVKRVKNPQTNIPSYDDDNSSSSGSTVGFGSGSSVSSAPLTPTESELPFTDLTKSHWGYSSIYSLYKKGIISGTSDKTVEPDRYVTREEFIKMLVVTFGLYNDNAVNTFSDIPAGDWSEKYVASAYEAGITQGNGGGTFGKGTYITRQDMVVMAARCAEKVSMNLAGETESFNDEAEFAEYAKEAIYKMAGAGIVNGVGAGKFSPSENCTRAMAAKVCNELLKMGGAAK